MMIKLYDYFRSSACFRVRIALNLKGLDYEVIPIHLINEGGEQHSVAYQVINPQELVPSLVTPENQIITQSLAIIDYLENVYPTHPIMPDTPLLRARALSMAYLIACDIHPLNNLRVLDYLVNHLQQSPEEKMIWYHHWLSKGFSAFENLLEKYPSEGKFCIGDIPTIADICLIPQWMNAKRYAFDLTPFPLLDSIATNAMTLPAFRNAAPK